MEIQARKTILRMIPYGLYILTAADEKGNKAAAAINWLTQASFQPPLVAVGVKVESGIYQVMKNSQFFGLHFLKKGQQDVAFAFFKPTKEENGKLNGYTFQTAPHGSPLLEIAGAFVECKRLGQLEYGDHTVFVGEVVEAQLKETIQGRPDDWILWLRDLGENIFYGG